MKRNEQRVLLNALRTASARGDHAECERICTQLYTATGIPYSYARTSHN